MATRKVPPGTSPLEERIQEEVPFDIYYVAHFPIWRIGGKLDKDYCLRFSAYGPGPVPSELCGRCAAARRAGG